MHDAAPMVAPESLMNRVAHGDQAAFAQLYDHIAGPILATTTQVLRDRGQAEEVTQEVLLEIWRTAANFAEHKGSVLTWATTIARRRAIDRVRHESAAAARVNRVGRLNLGRPLDDVVEAVLARFERNEAHETMREALHHLSDVQRQSILLAYFGNCTYRQVAERLGIPLGTAKSRIQAALTRLRDVLLASVDGALGASS